MGSGLSQNGLGTRQACSVSHEHLAHALSCMASALACSLTGVAIEMLLHVSGLEKAPIECSLSREKQEATVTQEKTTLKTKEV